MKLEELKMVTLEQRERLVDEIIEQHRSSVEQTI